MKILYRCRDVVMVKQDETYIVMTGYAPAPETEQGCTCKTALTFTNPLLAWDNYVSTMDNNVRRRIGDALEQHGRNRYTGEEMKNSG